MSFLHVCKLADITFFCLLNGPDSLGRSVHGPMATDDSRTSQTKGEIGRMFGGDGLADVIGTHAVPYCTNGQLP